MSTSLLRLAAAQSDIDLFIHIERSLYTAVIADSLDQLGYRNQAMRGDVRRLFPSAELMRGAHLRDVYEEYGVL
jgi:hypothetical protein